MNTKLVEIAKRKCNITWEDTDTNYRIEEIVEEAEIALRDKLGISENQEIDFTKGSRERNLFKNYCFYEWNNKVNEFDENYMGDIMQLRQKYEVKQYETEEQEL